jgi:hypothetical protein|tara:strand:+ start:313 stop:681 length:369 start_codon:yes stop_codon:yes gene_type:complete
MEGNVKGSLEQFITGPSISQTNIYGKEPVKVTKYVNGKAQKPKWITAAILNVDTWKNQDKIPKTRFCPLCKKDYETKNKNKKFCYDCQALRSKRIRKEHDDKKKAERLKNPQVRRRGKSKYS